MAEELVHNLDAMRLVHAVLVLGAVQWVHVKGIPRGVASNARCAIQFD